MESERGDLGGTVPSGAVLGPDAKPDAEATRRFTERFTDQARDHLGHGGDRGREQHRDEED